MLALVGTDLRMADAGDVGRLLGTKWKEMSDEEKKVRWLRDTSTHAALRGSRKQGQGACGSGKGGLCGASICRSGLYRTRRSNFRALIGALYYDL